MQPAFASELRRPAHATPEPSVTVTMGEMCRTLRQQAGVSLNEMARITHRDTSTLSRFERGHSRPRDIDNLVRAYRQLLPQTQPRIQRSDRPRLWPLLYLVASPLALLPLTLAGPPQWDSVVARTWLILSLAVLICTIAPTVIRDLRMHRHPVAIISRIGYALALVTIATQVLLHWDTQIHPVAFLQAAIVAALGFVTIAYDRVEHESAPTE